MRMTLSGPRAIVTGATLASLIAFAYDLKPYEIGEGGWPAWKSEQFDISAKAAVDGELTRDQFRLLFQTLLVDRFKLKFHRETKQVSGYLLTVGRNGSRMKAAIPDETSGMSLVSPHKDVSMIVSNWTMEQLTRQLTVMFGEPVLDDTGLTGSYDYQLNWGEDNSQYGALLTAIQDQLGLKLQAHKGPIQVLVVDGVVKPSLD